MRARTYFAFIFYLNISLLIETNDNSFESMKKMDEWVGGMNW